MGKLDDLMKSSRGIASESMGRPATVPMNGSSSHAAAAAPDRLQGVARSKSAAEIPLSKIAPDPAQPREDFDAEALGRLAESMKARGQLQPIRVRWDDGAGRYVIVCGERRWRAAEQAGMSTMSCVIMDGPVTPGELLTIQVVENALREDLRPIEQAKAFRALMDLNGWSTHQVARELAVDQSTVVKTLALLALPPAVQEQVEQGALSPSVAYEVGKLDSADAQVKVAAQVVSEGLSRAETVEAVKRVSGRSKSKAKGRGARKPTSRVFRLAGYRITVENRRGLERQTLAVALKDALHLVEAEPAESDAA
jgi:ParB family transcriptional regulator, chromosome partitioning protein